jgi:hypothetical protein
MQTYYYSLFLVFIVIALMIVIDQNVGDYIILLTKIIKLNIERFFWMVRLHPKNPITNLIKRWEYDKLAKELEEEFKNKDR